MLQLHYAGYCDFGPEVMGKDQKVRLLLTSQDEVCSVDFCNFVDNEISLFIFFCQQYVIMTV